MVTFETTLGNFTFELYADKAPLTVKNFLSYVEKKHYDNTVFHRVIPQFMIQGGGFDATMTQKKTDAPIKNEAKNGLKNVRGSVAMARTSDVDSATSQFFINIVDNDFLNNGTRDFGYCVFAQVVEGMDVIDKIVAVKTANRGGHQNVPIEPVVIKTARAKLPSKA